MTDEELTRKELRRKERHEVYNSMRWRNLRRLLVQEKPLCEDCLRRGVLTPTEECHHILSPFRKGLTPEEKDRLAYDPKNIVCLCKECHIKRHLKDMPMAKKLERYKD